MTHEQDPTTDEGRTTEEREPGRQDGQDDEGTVSEGGSGALNPDTSLGGADSVPDTPDVNTEVSDTADTNEPSQEG